MAPRRMLGLAAVGSAAGLFSGLFGVGGGAVVVPLLVLRFAYPDRAAMGTSLLAIAVMAGAAMLTQGAYGNLHVDDGLLVGVPAVGGVIAGTWLQQPARVRTVRLLFAVVLGVAAVDLAPKGLRRSSSARSPVSSPACSASAAACCSSPRSPSSS